MAKINVIVARTGFETQCRAMLANNVDILPDTADTELNAFNIGETALEKLAKYTDLDNLIVYSLGDTDIYEIDMFENDKRTLVGWEIEAYIYGY